MVHEKTKSLRHFHYQDGNDSANVTVQEILDPSYGSYIWPSSLVMADYVWRFREQFDNTVVLELGAGTALPSLLLSKYFANEQVRIIVTDMAYIIPNIQAAFKLNEMPESQHRLWIQDLLWGKFGAHGIDELAQQVDRQWHRKIDWILGSDTFYDPADFENLIVTVAYVIHRHNKNARFITAYQERSSKRSIQHLLDKWSLSCRLIPKATFDFDDSKYIQDDESSSDDESTNSTTSHIRIRSGALASVFLLEITALS